MLTRPRYRLIAGWTRSAAVFYAVAVLPLYSIERVLGGSWSTPAEERYANNIAYDASAAVCAATGTATRRFCSSGPHTRRRRIQKPDLPPGEVRRVRTTRFESSGLSFSSHFPSALIIRESVRATRSPAKNSAGRRTHTITMYSAHYTRVHFVRSSPQSCVKYDSHNVYDFTVFEYGPMQRRGLINFRAGGIEYTRDVRRENNFWDIVPNPLTTRSRVRKYYIYLLKCTAYVDVAFFVEKSK